MSWIKSNIEKISSIAGKLKIYYSSAAFYISMINFLMILATAKKTYDIDISLFVVVPIGIAGAMLVGWLDYTFVMKHQLKHTNKQNDIKIQLNRIEEKLNLINYDLEKKNEDTNI